jgi:hypothetical protein
MGHIGSERSLVERPLSAPKQSSDYAWLYGEDAPFAVIPGIVAVLPSSGPNATFAVARPSHE